MLRKLMDRHDVDRYDVKQVCWSLFFELCVCILVLVLHYWFASVISLQVVCAVCDTEQPVSNGYCSNCLHFSISFSMLLFGIIMLYGDWWVMFGYCSVKSGRTRLHKLRCQHGGVLLWDLQVLWWWCIISGAFYI